MYSVVYTGYLVASARKENSLVSFLITMLQVQPKVQDVVALGLVATLTDLVVRYSLIVNVPILQQGSSISFAVTVPVYHIYVKMSIHNTIFKA